jgi:hypothetical protein
MQRWRQYRGIRRLVGWVLSVILLLGVPSAQAVDLLVSSFFTDQVLRYDGATGAFLNAFVAAGSGGLSGPARLIFGPDGHLYVSSIDTAQVLRYNGATGAFLDTFVAAGSGGLNAPLGLAFGPDGHLYVSSFFTAQVLRYDGVTGAFLDAFVAAGSGGLAGPSFLTFGAVAASVTTHCRTLGDDPPPSRLDQDVFRFTGTSGETVTLTLAPDPDTGQTSQRATLLLTDRIAGVFFARFDSSALPNTVQATLPATGAYQVMVAEHPDFLPGDPFLGAYCVTLVVRGGVGNLRAH